MSSLQFTVSPPYFFPLTLDATVTGQNIKDTINSLALEAAPRDTASALTAVLFSLFGTSPRQDVPKVIMVLTHGTSLIPFTVNLAAATVESQGVVIVPIGVGQSVPLGTLFFDELQYIATDVNNVVQETFISLQGEVPPTTVTGKLCEGILIITKTCPCKIQGFCTFKNENFTKKKKRKKKDNFLNFAQNIDCGFSSEQP